MIPVDRQTFKDYCLRKLGYPVTDVNVSEEQIDDRVDEAIFYFNKFHYDGTEKNYYKYQVTDTDITNRYITMPANIIGVSNIFDITALSGSNNLFSASFQLALSDLFSINGMDLVPYYSVLQNLSLIQQILVGQKPIRFNSITNILHLDMDWATVPSGMFLLIDCYSVIDPSIYPNFWKEEWLVNYACQLIKQQFGTNLKKYNMPMVGGVTFNGQQIYNEATEELKAMRQELNDVYSPIMMNFMA